MQIFFSLYKGRRQDTSLSFSPTWWYMVSIKKDAVKNQSAYEWNGYVCMCMFTEPTPTMSSFSYYLQLHPDKYSSFFFKMSQSVLCHCDIQKNPAGVVVFSYCKALDPGLASSCQHNSYRTLAISTLLWFIKPKKSSSGLLQRRTHLSYITHLLITAVFAILVTVLF